MQCPAVKRPMQLHTTAGYSRRNHAVTSVRSGASWPPFGGASARVSEPLADARPRSEGPRLRSASPANGCREAAPPAARPRMPVPCAQIAAQLPACGPWTGERGGACGTCTRARVRRRHRRRPASGPPPRRGAVGLCRAARRPGGAPLVRPSLPPTSRRPPLGERGRAKTLSFSIRCVGGNSRFSERRLLRLCWGILIVVS